MFNLLSSEVAAQNSVPTPTPFSQQQTAGDLLRRERDSQDAFDRLKNASDNSRSETDPARGLSNLAKNPAYRKPTKKDLMLVAPDAADQAKYAEFLRQPKTELIRLLSDAGCQENADLFVASEFCIKYQNLFGGAAYSFRTGQYTLGRFADIVYKNGSIYSIGKMTLGVITDLGENVSLNDISARMSGAKYVFDFVPPDDLPNAEMYLAEIQNGIEKDGFKYRRFYELKENHVYLLRSVAYRKRAQWKNNRRVYDDLSNDERKDVIVALQVVRFGDADKSNVILLWKELQRKSTPKISVEAK